MGIEKRRFTQFKFIRITKSLYYLGQKYGNFFDKTHLLTIMTVGTTFPAIKTNGKGPCEA